MATWFDDAPSAAEIARELIEDHHGHLRQALTRFVFRHSTNWSRQGEVVLGSARRPGSLEVFLSGHELDFVIVLNYGTWLAMTPGQQKAEVDHELSHCGRNEKDEWCLWPHDVEEFAAVIDRHGLWRRKLETFGASVQHAPQQLHMDVDGGDDGEAANAGEHATEQVGGQATDKPADQAGEETAADGGTSASAPERAVRWAGIDPGRIELVSELRRWRDLAHKPDATGITLQQAAERVHLPRKKTLELLMAAQSDGIARWDGECYSLIADSTSAPTAEPSAPAAETPGPAAEPETAQPDQPTAPPDNLRHLPTDRGADGQDGATPQPAEAGGRRRRRPQF